MTALLELWSPALKICTLPWLVFTNSLDMSSWIYFHGAEIVGADCFFLTAVDAGTEFLYLFALMTFYIYLQECAKSKVLFDSFEKSFDGDKQASIVVLQFPPIESLRRRVSLESL